MGSPDAPIFSDHRDDPEMAGLLEEFVLGLAERVDHLQDADGRGDLPLLAELARSLAGDASRAGYPPLSRCASAVESCSVDGKSDDAHAQLVDLTDLAQRVRRGHRGSL